MPCPAASPRLLIGMGTGRCGTRSLAVLLSRQPATVVTHEMRPLLPWQRPHVPGPISDRFHGVMEREPQMKRVGDVASSYLPYVEDILGSFDDVRIICLRRDRQETIDSFIRWLAGTRAGRPVNHWSADRAGFEADRWDALFPKYSTRDPAQGIGRYWDEYYARAEDLVHRFPQQIRIFETNDTLNDPRGMSELLGFVGVPADQRAAVRVHLNQSCADGGT